MRLIFSPFCADGIGTMFETRTAVDAKVVEGGFDDVVCFSWGDCHLGVLLVGCCRVSLCLPAATVMAQCR